MKVYHFYAQFNVKVQDVIKRYDAHVYAMNELDCTIMLKKALVNIGVFWNMHSLEKLQYKPWLIAGKNYQRGPQVESLQPYVEHEFNLPLLDFLYKYGDFLRCLPVNTVQRYIANVKNGETPVRLDEVHVQILADFTGESEDVISRMAALEYAARFVRHVISVSGRRIIQAAIGKDFVGVLKGIEQDAEIYEKLAAIAGFNKVMPVQAGELLYLTDVNSASTSDERLYRDDTLFGKLSTKARDRLVEKDERFLEIFKQYNFHTRLARLRR